MDEIVEVLPDEEIKVMGDKDMAKMIDKLQNMRGKRRFGNTYRRIFHNNI